MSFPTRIVLCAASVLSLLPGLMAEQVTLAWDPPSLNTDGSALTNLACYVLYYGRAPGDYEFAIDSGKDTRATVTGLQAGVTYYFAVEAYNTWNCGSELSPEITFTPTVSPPVTDADTDGMPDAWEIERFGSVGPAPEGDPDSDGFSNLEEYVAGTDPEDADSGPYIITTVVKRFLTYTFEALAAYPGTGTRWYALERTDNPDNPAWIPVPGYEAVAGQNQLVSYQERTKKRYYYRLNIWLD